MMRRIGCLVILALLLTASTGLAENSPSVDPSSLLEDLVYDDFILSLDSKWVPETAEGGDDALLGSAITIDNTNRLTVFLSGEGDEDKVLELAAVNEYSSGIKREGAEIINGVRMIFAASPETKTACVYFGINGNLYTISVSSVNEDCSIEELSENLHGIMRTLTLHNPE